MPTAPAVEAPSVTTEESKGRDTIADLVQRRMLFVTGKGGVGKTTIAASLARVAADQGKRVLLCEVAPEPAFARVFAERPLEPPVVGFEPTPLADRIWAAQCEPTQCLVAFLTRFVRIRRFARALVKNRVANRFFDATPGVMETVVLERVVRLANGLEPRQPEFDLVVVDLPASGHAVTFLDVPRSMASVVRVGPLAEHLTALAEQIADPRRAEMVLVSLPEEMSVAETVELWQVARNQLEVPLHTIVINRVRRTGLPEDIAEALRQSEAGNPGEVLPDGASLALRAARLTARWEARDDAQVEQLRSRIDGRFVCLPWIGDFEHESALIGALSRHWGSHPP
jgi:anion-transporting  ArsA/GET3 family ATPase